jgi:hypothetical protein
MKKIIIGSAIFFVITGVCFLGFGKLQSANALEVKAKSKLVDITKNEFGDIKVTKSDKLDEKISYVEMEDNKFTYKVNPLDEEIINLGIKNSDFHNHNKVKGNLSVKDAQDKSKVYLQKYIPNSNIDFINSDTFRKTDDSQDIYVVNYEGVSKNGVKTGDFVSLWINQEGDIISFARHKGNSDVSSNIKAKISEKEAINISKNKVMSFDEFYAKNSISFVEKCELNVWDNKLVYNVTLSHCEKGIEVRTFYVKVDSENGNVVDFNYTK